MRTSNEAIPGGSVDISEGATATVVRDAVRACDGVVGIGKPRRDLLMARLARPWTRRSIKVTVENVRIAVCVPIVVEYGTPIGTVARNVVQSVTYRLKSALGMPVERVHVHVTGLRVTSPEQAA